MNRFLPLAFLLIVLSCARQRPEQASSEQREETRVEIGLEAQRHIGLQSTQTVASDLKEYLQATGTVQPIDSRIGHVRSLARGRLLEILAKVGDRVQQGQPLARIDNMEAGELASQYEAARAELNRLKVQRAAAARLSERSKRLVEIGAVARKEFEATQSEESSLDASIEGQQSTIAGITARLQRFGLEYPNIRSSSQTLIRSPFPGIIIKAAVAPGEVVGEESDLFEVADLRRVWVQAEVYEKDLARITTGQDALITIDTYPDQKFVGKVTYIGDILDRETRTARVRCEAPNDGLLLKLDMFAAVRLPTKFSRRAIAIPSGAIQQWENKNFVFIRTGPTRFDAREVTLGKIIDGETEITLGLKEGDAIVTTGAFHLKSILRSKELGAE